MIPINFAVGVGEFFNEEDIARGHLALVVVLGRSEVGDVEVAVAVPTNNVVALAGSDSDIFFAVVAGVDSVNFAAADDEVDVLAAVDDFGCLRANFDLFDSVVDSVEDFEVSGSAARDY